MINRFADHLLVLPEDDANRRMVNGFLRHPAVNLGSIQVLHEAGGWRHVLDSLKRQDVLTGLQKYSKRHFLLLIDFDSDAAARLETFAKLRSALAADVQDRVYLIGALEHPERLRAECSLQLETIGWSLAAECAEPAAAAASRLWQHPHLVHNQVELGRLLTRVRPFLCP